MSDRFGISFHPTFRKFGVSNDLIEFQMREHVRICSKRRETHRENKMSDFDSENECYLRGAAFKLHRMENESAEQEAAGIWSDKKREERKNKSIEAKGKKHEKFAKETKEWNEVHLKQLSLWALWCPSSWKCELLNSRVGWKHDKRCITNEKFDFIRHSNFHSIFHPTFHFQVGWKVGSVCADLYKTFEFYYRRHCNVTHSHVLFLCWNLGVVNCPTTFQKKHDMTFILKFNLAFYIGNVKKDNRNSHVRISTSLYLLKGKLLYLSCRKNERNWSQKLMEPFLAGAVFAVSLWNYKMLRCFGKFPSRVYCSSIWKDKIT